MNRSTVILFSNSILIQNCIHTSWRFAVADPGEAGASGNCWRRLGRNISTCERFWRRTTCATGARPISKSRQQRVQGTR